MLRKYIKNLGKEKSMNKTSFIMFVMFAILAIFAVNYFAEVNRLILLVIVYPSCVFGALGLYALFENN